jgi:hypothetical protein
MQKQLTTNINRVLKGVSLVNAKRILMAMIICVTAATIAGAQRGNGSLAAQSKKTLTGTWLLTITPDEPGAQPFEGLYTFTSDGIALFSSVGPPIPALGNPGHGIWVKTGPTTFLAKFKQFTFDDIFTVNGSLVITSTITMGDGDSFTSQDTGGIYDLNGNLIIPIGGSQQGRRMTIN